MDIQGTQKTQHNFERSWGTHISQFQNLLKCYTNQRQFGTSIRIDILTNGTKLEIHKETRQLGQLVP